MIPINPSTPIRSSSSPLEREEIKKLTEEISTLLNCPISLGPMEDPVTLKCGHSLDRVFLQDILRSENSLCPLCRKVISRDPIASNITLKSLIEKITQLFDILKVTPVSPESSTSLNESYDRGLKEGLAQLQHKIDEAEKKGLAKGRQESTTQLRSKLAEAEKSGYAKGVKETNLLLKRSVDAAFQKGLQEGQDLKAPPSQEEPPCLCQGIKDHIFFVADRIYDSLEEMINFFQKLFSSLFSPKPNTCLESLEE